MFVVFGFGEWLKVDWWCFKGDVVNVFEEFGDDV